MVEVPDTNIELVALNIVSHAMIDDVVEPGLGLQRLFSEMGRIAGEIAGIRRASSTDWEGVADDIKGTVERQAISIGELWAYEWALAHIATPVSGVGAAMR